MLFACYKKVILCKQAAQLAPALRALLLLAILQATG